jgi:hypothetical protein
MDLTVSVIVFWVLYVFGSKKLQMKNSWAYLLATIIGWSFLCPTVIPVF